VSWLFSQALVEASSAERSSGGGPCAQLSVMPTAQPFWHRDKPMDASRFSRFGPTSRLLTAEHGEVLLTWFREDFLARTSPSPAAEMDSTASAQDSGERWPASFARWDPDTSTWRTAQCSLLGGYTEFSETWPNSGSMRNGECWERPTLELTTSESGSGFLPTPVAIDTGSRFNRSASEGAALRPTLGAMARFDLWPTPTVKGNYNRKGLSSKSGDGLATAVLKYPTPTLGRTVRNLDGNGQLNPTWVEWLMGWPIGWTALQPLAMDKFREWQRQHGGDSTTE
jgi:hypothetical protein